MEAFVQVLIIYAAVMMGWIIGRCDGWVSHELKNIQIEERFWEKIRQFALKSRN